MSRIRTVTPRWVALALTLGTVAALGTATVIRASDHQDTPEVELAQLPDINDVYAFPGSSADRIALVMTTSSPIAGLNASFDPDLLYPQAPTLAAAIGLAIRGVQGI